jgi:hypothetical protein
MPDPATLTDAVLDPRQAISAPNAPTITRDARQPGAGTTERREAHLEAVTLTSTASMGPTRHDALPLKSQTGTKDPHHPRPRDVPEASSVSPDTSPNRVSASFGTGAAHPIPSRPAR